MPVSYVSVAVARALLGVRRMKGMKHRGSALGSMGLMVFAVSLPGCGRDGEAALQGPLLGKPLAVGAYHSLTYGDACAGEGKFSFCGVDLLLSVDELSSKNPEIARIVLAEDVPIGTTSATHFVFGVAPGNATLHFRGTFDDGSVRSTDLEIEVKEAGRSSLRTTCAGVELAEVLTLPSAEASFEVKLFAGSTELAGFHPDAVASMDGVTPAILGDSRNTFMWAAPPEPTVVEVHSGFLPGRVGLLRAYAASEVSDVVVKSPNGTSLILWAPGSVGIQAATWVRGVEPCDAAPVVFKTETPAVCSGPDGAETWPGETEYGGFVEMNAEGVCRISAAADGVRFFSPTSLRMFIVTEPGAERFDGFDQPCAVEGSTSCTYGDTSQVTLCRNGRWVSRETCGPARTCDARDPALGGCVAGGPCSECRAMR
jgi:hypothetical protein